MQAEKRYKNNEQLNSHTYCTEKRRSLFRARKFVYFHFYSTYFFIPTTNFIVKLVFDAMRIFVTPKIYINREPVLVEVQ